MATGGGCDISNNLDDKKLVKMICQWSKKYSISNLSGFIKYATHTRLPIFPSYGILEFEKFSRWTATLLVPHQTCPFPNVNQLPTQCHLDSKIFLDQTLASYLDGKLGIFIIKLAQKHMTPPHQP